MGRPEMFLIHDQKNGRQQIWAAVADGGDAWLFHVHGAGRDTKTADDIHAAFAMIKADPAPVIAACPTLAGKPCAS